MNKENLRTNAKFTQVTRLLKSEEKEKLLSHLDNKYHAVYMKSLKGRICEHIVFDCRFYIIKEDKKKLKSTFRDLWQILAEIYYPYYNNNKHYTGSVVSKNLKQDGACALSDIHVYNKDGFINKNRENSSL